MEGKRSERTLKLTNLEEELLVIRILGWRGVQKAWKDDPRWFIVEEGGEIEGDGEDPAVGWAQLK